MSQGGLWVQGPGAGPNQTQTRSTPQTCADHKRRSIPDSPLLELFSLAAFLPPRCLTFWSALGIFVTRLPMDRI